MALKLTNQKGRKMSLAMVLVSVHYTDGKERFSASGKSQSVPEIFKYLKHILGAQLIMVQGQCAH